MARAFSSYDVIGTGSHATATSTGTADIKTISPPTVNGVARASAMLLSVKTIDARVTFDGTAPGVGVAPGLVFKAGQQPYLLPFAKGIKFASDAVGSSEVNVLWLV